MSSDEQLQDREEDIYSRQLAKYLGLTHDELLSSSYTNSDFDERFPMEETLIFDSLNDEVVLDKIKGLSSHRTIRIDIEEVSKIELTDADYNEGRPDPNQLQLPLD